jgi:hypothetical protein
LPGALHINSAQTYEAAATRFTKANPVAATIEREKLELDLLHRHESSRNGETVTFRAAFADTTSSMCNDVVGTFKA